MAVETFVVRIFFIRHRIPLRAAADPDRPGEYAIEIAVILQQLGAIARKQEQRKLVAMAD